MFGSPIVTEKVRLKKDHTRDFKKMITLGILKKDHTQDSKKGSHSGL